MKRRRFLTSLGGLATMGFVAPWARAVSGDMAHGMHASMSQAATELADITALPKGALLADLPRLANTTKQDALFRATLVAAPTKHKVMTGTETQCWTYNGNLPGPLIDVFEGDTVEILLENRLPQATTIHWHGLPVPPEHDGNPQDAVPPGEQRWYRFTLPKGSAGTYWYHPHPHGTTPEQVFRGMAGVFIVRTKEDPLADIPERLLLVSDLKLAKDGQIAPNDTNDEMNGREGQFVLVNGQHQPILRFHQGGRERWRIWNASNARYLRLTLPGMRFALVGTDGGLLEHPIPNLTEWLVAPAQRVELIVEVGEQPGLIDLTAAVYARGKMGSVQPDQPQRLLTVDFGAVKATTLAPLPTVLRRIEPLGRHRAKKRVVFSEEMSMADGRHDMKFLLNGRRYDMSRVDLISRINQIELWEIVNQADMDHPFHIHGTQFQVVESVFEGKTTRPAYRAWYDTVNLRAGEIVRIKLVQSFKGLRMFHCHILEHENAGMMAQLKVI
nr:multicopper oxidase family protein [Chitinivorax sp. B]